MAPRIYAGRFDPRFLGVSIRAIGASDADSFLHHDRSRPAPVAVLAELGDDALVSDLSRQTVLDHELRHFRDSLLFPFGAVATRSRIHASYNGFRVAMTVKLLRGDANVLPVPLQQWLRMSAPERDKFLASEAAFAGEDLRPPQLPVIARDDDVSGFAPGLLELDPEEVVLTGSRVALGDYQMVESVWRSPHTEGEEMVSPAVDTWEAAGLICQLAAIERYAGDPPMQRFVGWLERHGPRTYRRGLAMLTWCLEKFGWPPTMRNHLALVTWAQMGAYETEKAESSPLHRLGALVLAAEHGARWAEGSTFADLVENWDAVTGADSFGSLRAATATFGGFCRRTVRSGGMTSYLPDELFTSLAEARERMLAAFVADPDTYVDPVAYLAAETRYPLPCVGLEYPSGALGSDWADVTPSGWSPVVSFDATLRLAVLALISDAVFLPGEKSLQRDGRLAISRTLDLRAIRIIR